MAERGPDLSGQVANPEVWDQAQEKWDDGSEPDDDVLTELSAVAEPSHPRCGHAEIFTVRADKGGYLGAFVCHRNKMSPWFASVTAKLRDDAVTAHYEAEMLIAQGRGICGPCDERVLPTEGNRPFIPEIPPPGYDESQDSSTELI